MQKSLNIIINLVNYTYKNLYLIKIICENIIKKKKT